MMCFPGMLVEAAAKAGIKVPDDPDNVAWDFNKFPHFTVLCALQLNRPIVRVGEHWDNAKIVAEFPEDKLKTAVLQDFLNRGLSWAN